MCIRDRYKFRQQSTWYTRLRRRTRRAWQPATMLALFVLGTACGLLAALQQDQVIATLTGRETTKDVVMITKGTDSANMGEPTTKGTVAGVAIGKKTVAQAKAAGVRPLSCGAAAPKRVNLEAAAISQLRKLAEHDAVCGNATAARVSFFVGTPTTPDQAREEAIWVADTLKEISKFGLGAVVFMEPSYNGASLNTAQYKAGAYDVALEAYFAALKSKGVTDAQMGVWVPFPEANIPVWNSVNPDDFIATVSRTVQFQKKHFPGSKASVMLDSKSYPSATSWEGGTYKSLLPYVAGMPKGLIDSVGLQGFSWPPQYGDPAQLDPSVFLPHQLAVEAAAALGVKDIWFNTGSYMRAARENKSKPDSLSSAQRQKVMDGIVAQAKNARSKGYNVSIHLFAEDKFATAEAIDWSFWDKGQSDAASHKPVYRTFINDLRTNNIPLWLFDSL